VTPLVLGATQPIVQATPEEQLPQLTAAVTAAGDAVKQLKTDKVRSAAT
jgi:hypothetical protein